MAGILATRRSLGWRAQRDHRKALSLRKTQRANRSATNTIHNTHDPHAKHRTESYPSGRFGSVRSVAVAPASGLLRVVLHSAPPLHSVSSSRPAVPLLHLNPTRSPHPEPANKCVQFEIVQGNCAFTFLLWGFVIDTERDTHKKKTKTESIQLRNAAPPPLPFRTAARDTRS